MTWALVIIFIAIVVIMSLNNAGRIPWGDKMRRLNAGSVQKVEWMAPDRCGRSRCGHSIWKRSTGCTKVC